MHHTVSITLRSPSRVCCVWCVGEDDGYLMVYVTKPDGSSYMHVYDAATMDATPVAEVRDF